MRQMETHDREEKAVLLFGEGPVRVSDIVGANFTPGRCSQQEATDAAPRRIYCRAIRDWYDLGMFVLFASSVIAVLCCLLHG